mmetsp:Transcript_61799/g.180608  ORF Transcript_61799/g.180608 Transcript_61799/m.180608 type:complete len:229 (+) Transcript_61799:78-764(+)
MLGRGSWPLARMPCKLACPWPAFLATVVALAKPVVTAALNRRALSSVSFTGSSSLRWSGELPATEEPEPTPDTAGLFGPPFKIPLLSVDTGEVAAEVQMQLALTPAEQHHGLMFRRSLADESGMLFLYTRPSRRVLWMKNTLVPLDAAWFTSDGVLREVQHLLPLDLTYRWSDREDVSMGLETPQGYFQKHGFTPGSLKLDLAALSAALLERGFNPKEFLKFGMGPQP